MKQYIIEQINSGIDKANEELGYKAAEHITDVTITPTDRIEQMPPQPSDEITRILEYMESVNRKALALTEKDMRQCGRGFYLQTREGIHHIDPMKMYVMPTLWQRIVIWSKAALSVVLKKLEVL